MQAKIALITLKSVPAINQFGTEMLEFLSQKGVWLDFALNEIVVTQGKPLRGMYLIISGTAKLFVTNARGHQQVLGQLSKGEFFGEKASLLIDQISDVSVIAVEDLTLLLLDKTAIQLMLENSPRLANDIGEVMELRRRSVAKLHQAA